MRILVVNDDGIKAPGIHRLAKMAAGLGEVWVVAPDAQCSAMSQRITVRGDLEVSRGVRYRRILHCRQPEWAVDVQSFHLRQEKQKNH